MADEHPDPHSQQSRIELAGIYREDIKKAVVPRPTPLTLAPAQKARNVLRQAGVLTNRAVEVQYPGNRAADFYLI